MSSSLKIQYTNRLTVLIEHKTEYHMNGGKKQVQFGWVDIGNQRLLFVRSDRLYPAIDSMQRENR